jgi:hypothetical protein
VGLPRQLPPSGPGSGRGPFGERAFKAALVGCVVLLVLGAVMVLLASGGLRAVGTSFIALGAVGLITSAAGALAERLLHRQPPPPADVRSGNGRSPHPRRIVRSERSSRKDP